MGIYKAWTDGYARETTWANETASVSDDIPNTNAVTYSFGPLSQKSIHPSPKTQMVHAPTAVNELEVSAGELWKASFESTGVYGLILVNGIILQAVMGKSSTADDTPSAGLYTHTITPPTATGGVLSAPPSFAIQHEKTGTATTWATQFLGCTVTNLNLSCSFDRPLGAQVVWMAKKPNKVAFVLTTKPVLPPTANIAAYHLANTTITWDYGGTPVTVAGLIDMELNINTNITALYGAIYEAGTFIGMYPYEFMRGKRYDYQLTMNVMPESSAMWEELLASSNTKDMRFKWARSATDYIQADLVDCNVLSYDIMTPEQNSDDPSSFEDIAQVVIEPRQISFTVVDSITGTHYGG